MTHSFPTRRSSDLHNGAAAPRYLWPTASFVRCAARLRTAPANSRRERYISASTDRSHPARPPARSCERARSEEHTSELQSLMRISYAVFCLKKQTYKSEHHLIITRSNKPPY